MIPKLREKFNSEFTDQQYQEMLGEMDKKYPGSLVFRVAETPIFVPKEFTQKILSACESIVDVIVKPGFMELTKRAIPPSENVPGDEGHADFIAFDFGVCENEAGELEPQLVEMQGFPTLFGFQAYYPEILREHFSIPDNFSHYMNGYNRESYVQLLKDIILNGHAPEEVILLELNPHEQKTRVDFYCTQDLLHIPIVGLKELSREGDQLFYEQDGKRIRVKRIYNRIIFDELNHIKDTLGDIVDITQPLDVEWATHPNWFYRISKFTLPYLEHPYVPKTHFLSDIPQIPDDLENYVLKPLFSFAGQGVIIDVNRKDIEDIKDPENWILQRKVHYADIIKTPDIPAKAEIRIFYFWEKGAARPVAACNLVRLSKGKMIGVRYNMDKAWVGGSVAYFENN